jgi:hypothetical protein
LAAGGLIRWIVADEQKRDFEPNGLYSLELADLEVVDWEYRLMLEGCVLGHRWFGLPTQVVVVGYLKYRTERQVYWRTE